MPWFRVDDQLDANKKVKSIPRRTRAKALGLWVQAGAWCARELTDGHVPKYMLEDFAVTPAVAQALVDAGMWEKVKDGWNFVNWSEFNPSSTDVRASRDAARKRQAEFREKKKQERENADTSNNRKLSQRDTPVTNSVTNGVTNAPVTRPRPDPTRPDPTITRGEVVSQPYGPNARETDMAGGDPLDELAAATRRARQAGIPETAIAEGTRRYQAKPEPKGPGLLRTLIDEAAGDLQSQEQTEHARATRRAAITACPWCDERGMLDGHHPDGTAWSMKCTHPDDMPTPQQPPAKPEPQGVPDTAAQFLARLEARTTGGPF
ncbi:hypothetical protein M3G47_01330 [Corynebacterium sanguinis]|uniref:hypothetical protein n=1 Tax=Corynebacterium sanguinis TaxID=2594913 RepID=UPI0021A6FC66|nr:hypothetical protein [Corynebacterium sanguinis]MCT1491339.1 hypothetical protein [Corynebacterium sanguinis]MCT2246742.1 hypothetical protein [Corynebacterium sanguinis]